MSRKKLIALSLFSLLLLTAIVVAIFYYGRKEPVIDDASGNNPPTPVNISSLIENTFPDSASPTGTNTDGSAISPLYALKKIVPGPIAGYWHYENTLHYATPDGYIHAASVEGTAEPIFVGGPIRSVRASADGSLVSITYRSLGRTLSGYYRASTGTFEKEQSLISTSAPSPDGSVLFSIKNMFGRSPVLIRTDLAENEAVDVATLALQDPILHPISREQTLVLTRPSIHAPGSAFIATTEAQLLRALAIDKNGLSLLWSPEQQIGLAFWVEDDANRGALINIEGDIERQLQVPLLPQKCVFFAQQMLCGAPLNVDMEKIENMPDVYLQQKVQTLDHLIAVDLESGRVATLYAPPSSMDMYDLRILDDSLYFINRYDGSLYQLIISDETTS